MLMMISDADDEVCVDEELGETKQRRAANVLKGLTHAAKRKRKNLPSKSRIQYSERRQSHEPKK